MEVIACSFCVALYCVLGLCIWRCFIQSVNQSVSQSESNRFLNMVSTLTASTRPLKLPFRIA